MNVLYVTYSDDHPDAKSQDKVIEYLKHFQTDVDITKMDITHIPKESKLNTYDLIILFFHYQEDMPEAAVKLIKYVKEGGTVVALHGAAASFKGNDDWFEFIGGKFVSHPPICKFCVEAGKYKGKITDEIYFMQIKEDIKIHANSIFEGRMSPCLWERKHNEGKIVYLALGHDLNAVDSDVFRHMFDMALKISTERI